MKTGIQFVLGVVTAICVVGGLLYVGVPGISDGHYVGPTQVLESSSPDGEHIARRERMSKSNGAWCEERATVDRAGERSNWEEQYVFINKCGMPVEFLWKDSRTLLVRYGYDTAGKAHVYRKAKSNDKQVSIEYELKEGA
jgi:hypothetical protein